MNRKKLSLVVILILVFAMEAVLIETLHLRGIVPTLMGFVWGMAFSITVQFWRYGLLD